MRGEEGFVVGANRRAGRNDGDNGTTEGGETIEWTEAIRSPSTQRTVFERFCYGVGEHAAGMFHSYIRESRENFPQLLLSRPSGSL